MRHFFFALLAFFPLLWRSAAKPPPPEITVKPREVMLCDSLISANAESLRRAGKELPEIEKALSEIEKRIEK